MDKGFAEMIFFAYIPLWASFGDWFAQLWAESLGKEGKGSQPVPAVGVTDQHSVNQMFMDGVRNKACLFLTCPSLPDGPRFPADLPDQFAYVRGKAFGELIRAEGLGTRMALSKNGVPLVEIQARSRTALVRRASSSGCSARPPSSPAGSWASTPWTSLRWNWASGWPRRAWTPTAWTRKRRT